MTTSHTPGPWQRWYSDGSWHVGQDSDKDSLFTGRQENQLNGNCEPDATLIASAPELLAAAKRYLAFRRQADCGFGYGFSGVHPATELENAIALAEGESV